LGDGFILIKIKTHIQPRMWMVQQKRLLILIGLKFVLNFNYIKFRLNSLSEDSV